MLTLSNWNFNWLDLEWTSDCTLRRVLFIRNARYNISGMLILYFQTMVNPAKTTSLLMKTLLISWSTVVLIPTLWFSVGKATFCPVTSPNDEFVYVTDTPSKLIIGLTKTGCAIECYAKYRDCRCFNYNVTSLNCSMFNFEPSSYGVDKSNNTRVYEVTELYNVMFSLSTPNCFE